MKKSILAVVFASTMMFGCAGSGDDFVCQIPDETPTPPPVEQTIRIESTQAKVDQFVRNGEVGFTNAVVLPSGVVESTSTIMAEHTVVAMKKSSGYSIMLVENQETKRLSIVVAAGDGKDYAVVIENATAEHQFSNVYLPNTILNDTDFVVVQDPSDQNKFSRYDMKMNQVGVFRLNTSDVIYIGTNSSPTFHDEFITVPIFINIDKTERQIFKYDGDRHQGWRIEDGAMALGISNDGDLVYAIESFVGGQHYMVKSIGNDSIVHVIGRADRLGVNFGNILSASTQDRFMSLYGNTVDVRNKEIIGEPTCSEPAPLYAPYTVGSTADYFICPANRVGNSVFTQTYERYDAATGERVYVDFTRPASPLRHGDESVTMKYQDGGIATYHVEHGITDVDNASDIVM